MPGKCGNILMALYLFRERNLQISFEKSGGLSILMAVFALALAGCAVISKNDQITALQKYDESKGETAKYVKKREENFDRLKDDIKNGLLQKGSPESGIVFNYGESVFCKDAVVQSAIKKSCLYRYPTKYFDADKIYLYFDEKDRLDSWELVPASKSDKK